MALTINKPTVAMHFIARTADGSVVLPGITHSNQLTSSGQPVLDWGPDMGTHLSELSTWSDHFLPLPTEGALFEGALYEYEGKMVAVRQAHDRTADAPADIPELFHTVRPLGTGIVWVANEQVGPGEVRTLGRDKWRCDLAHRTQTEPARNDGFWTRLNGP